MAGTRFRKRKRRSSKVNHQESRQRIKKHQKNKHILVVLKKNVILLFLSFVTILFLFTSVLLITTSFGKMVGYSMLPEVENNDIFTVDKVSDLRRFDLVYFKVPNKSGQKSVRRIIGLPGDELFYKNDDLYVNNEGKSERYLNSRKNELVGGLLTEDFNLSNVTGQLKVPEKKFFVLGDNRQSSADSRDYGFISENQIIGKVDIKIFPLNKLQRYR
ncbi:MAG: signal peptidase I [Vagococcus salmoninarum]|uniref:signal peptidase I n=1 Tax=Vagococcus salmoninarum TaxID=2739 RepID=UPI003F95508E